MPGGSPLQPLQDRLRPEPGQDLARRVGRGENLGQGRVEQGRHLDRGERFVERCAGIPEPAQRGPVQGDGIGGAPIERGAGVLFETESRGD